MSVMPKETHPPAQALQAGVIAFYILFASYIWRSLTTAAQRPPEIFRLYAGLELGFLLLFGLVMWRRNLPIILLYAYLVVQSVIAFYLVLIPPPMDFMTGFFIVLSYQIALLLDGRDRWVWWGIFVALTMISLIIGYGWIRGIAFGLIPVVGCIVLPLYVLASREEEQNNLKSEMIVGELRGKNAQLQTYTTQVEQIAMIEERNRLARELHDSVSQTMFSIMLNARAAQILQEQHPERLQGQLEELQQLSQEALAEMRSLISQLRPQTEETEIAQGDGT